MGQKLPPALAQSRDFTTLLDAHYFLQQQQHLHSSQVQVPVLQPSQHLHSSPQQQAFAAGLQQSQHWHSSQVQVPVLQPSQHLQASPQQQAFAAGLQQSQHLHSSQVQVPVLQPSQHLHSSPQQQALTEQQPSAADSPGQQAVFSAALVCGQLMPHAVTLSVPLDLPLPLLRAKAAVNERMTRTAAPRII